jgi:hypothetical protein
MPIAVHIIDSSLPLWQTASDVYRPILTAFPATDTIDLDYQSIEHIDVVRTWKGMSLNQAEELLLWEDGFRQALQTSIENYILEKSENAGVTTDQMETSKYPLS